ncbi:uncharacterized protein B0I36DRAFT_57619 [Microdochium trichocladiopsis]|uniref:Capsule polysaccharide biosynthesis protein n=1 Tax=Microdochium trichocladiopsis TaxID=1682393 RepID=A0A9P9BI44_9PEZI|nr:uncharacterized protein B0I36DRAFT_57619 [Microdochium trichocladiopsis]KAH7010607.1 hypothetical protein B0I36DRAFT_57619 [Microdochium trichocladiopsis]
MIQHFLVRRPHSHSPDKLFHPVISTTHTSLMEVDYNIHKSNSTYFADLDVSRTHLVAHLLAKGCHLAGNNAKTGLVLDPTTGRPARGKFGVMLGSVSCSFKREIRPFARYDMYSRVLAWDRKWMYIVTHFLEPGVAGGSGKHAPGKPLPAGWEKKVYATAISKYVFKIGRLTVHPAVLIGASGLLPERPGGWVTAPPEGQESSSSNSSSNSSSGVSTPPAGAGAAAQNGSAPVVEEEKEAKVQANGSADATEGTNGAAKPAEPVAAALSTTAESEDTFRAAVDGEWDWRRTEAELQRGLAYASHFAALEGLHGEFRGTEEGMLGRFSLG